MSGLKGLTDLSLEAKMLGTAIVYIIGTRKPQGASERMSIKVHVFRQRGWHSNSCSACVSSRQEINGLTALYWTSFSKVRVLLLT